MIRIDKVNKYYNKGRKNQIHVINNTTLLLEDKGLVALLGPSGCGKTTLLNVIGGLDKIKNGNIYIDDKKITRRSSYKIDKLRNLKIGYIFQDYKLVDTMSVYDNVSIVLKMLGIKDKEEIQKRVEYILTRVGMYRYRYRPCAMLSGGERQRVGIARALVKNPDIILADEPTGNLDSKNTIEIMNIIKSISKDKLVILVTHEVDLAKFYATRIIEILDGLVVKDYKNDKQDDLDYRVDNKFYLKDFKYQESNHDNNINIEMYSDTKEKLNLIIVFKNGNIYIKNKDSDKLEVVDSNSNIEFVNDNYKKIDRSIFDKYSFDFNNIINNNLKLRYSSIFNIFSLIKYGFEKVFSYSFLKKLLLVGFFLSSLFTTYAISNAFGILDVKDSEFVQTNKNYLILETAKNKYDDYLEWKQLESVNYLLPGDSFIDIPLKTELFYQVANMGNTFQLSGSLSSIKMITSNDIVYGRMPENENEIVVDKIIFDNLKQLKMIGIYDAERLIGLKAGDDNIDYKFTITGIVDLESPSIYASESEFMKILKLFKQKESRFAYTDEDSSEVRDYSIYEKTYGLKIVKGHAPKEDYEVVVNESLKDTFKLNKYINEVKVNDKKLKVVGYYTSKKDINVYFVSSNTANIDLITSNKNIIIYSNNKEETINEFLADKKYVKDVYLYDKDVYLNSIKDSVKSSLIVAGIMLAISLIEIILMVRSSFLSRKKEVGIFRAIGVKKTDIYKMFSSESFAITTLSSVPGVLLMSYIIYMIKDIPYIGNSYMMNYGVILICIIFLYLFNIIIGLIPVFNTVRKTPASILSSHEVD